MQELVFFIMKIFYVTLTLFVVGLIAAVIIKTIKQNRQNKSSNLDQVNNDDSKKE